MQPNTLFNELRSLMFLYLWADLRGVDIGERLREGVFLSLGEIIDLVGFCGRYLADRYSTGLAGQDAGEMIIYCFGARADLVLSEYQSRLAVARKDVRFDGAITQGLFRRSVHTHVNTGRDFQVRHLIVPLYFNPTR
ncbi:hypothetical protein [Neorhizobium galegae]|uniref:Uncharacterized protein n=1 Tax=Neorhizobium galegae bv. orientalis str. HAMBI 540 TaxID=1028800 RepID=A0A068SSF6_NEOGA|nr:hypothetical protein [Neorhizobium galegae]MCQ1856127.1 hypothetical protein [Neorhizobium galegae]CDN47980.1 Hypothetical protein RG540_CH18090 [Neorhizobium galegae bv. orientalis str. HAMBI 540]